MRCLVRDPRRLGAERVRVQIALGDLVRPPLLPPRAARRRHGRAPRVGDPRPAERLDRGARRRGHLAPGARGRAGRRRALRVLLRARCLDPQPRAADARQGGGRAGGRWSPRSRTPCSRRRSSTRPGDPFLRLLERMSLLPVMPISGSGRAPFQPIWAEDVADCVMAALPGGAAADAADGARYELAGPGHAHLPRHRGDRAAARIGRRRPVLRVPMPVMRRGLRAGRAADWARPRSPPGTRPSCSRSR